MFESPAPARAVFRIDPWSVEYGSSLDVDPEAEDPAAGCDPFVETEDWDQPITPHEAQAPSRIVFVDGVQRVDVWGRVQQGDMLLEAALASVAVGASICYPDRAEVHAPGPAARVLAASAGQTLDPIVVPLSRGELRFQPESSQRTGRDGVHDAIRTRRSELERRLAEDLTDDDSLVVLDGRLSFDPTRATPVVGFAKTIHRFYLDEPQRQLVFRLGERQRTPVFRIVYGDTVRYSWYLRLPFTRPIHHSLAGIVRLETPQIGDRAAIDLANLTSHHLPRFASRPEHDPRAPQNLLPIGGLERRLRHELGDAAFIRRAIEDHIAREARA
jgi:hypothetical protein